MKQLTPLNSLFNLLLMSVLYLPQLSLKHAYRSRKLKYVKFTSSSRVAILKCKQTAPLHFTGLVMEFKRITEASKVMMSVVGCPRNFLKLNICLNMFGNWVNRSKTSAFLCAVCCGFFTMGSTVAPMSSIRIFSDRELQTCS